MIIINQYHIDKNMKMKKWKLWFLSLIVYIYSYLCFSFFSPFEHGETFVLDDGGETDLDLGNYERFLDITLTRKHNITTGKIYQEVIHRERRGDYLGKTVQIVPHATDLIQNWIENVSMVPVDDSGKRFLLNYNIIIMIHHHNNLILHL